MFLMVEKRIRDGICHSIYRYVKANNKYMKNYYKNKEPSYLKYWEVNNLYGWAMSQKLPVNEDNIKKCDEYNDIGYFIEADVKYHENVHNLHNDLPFLPERIKIEKN